MALDGAYLYLVRQELSCLIGGRVDKIYQPARDTLIISLRMRAGSHRLLFSTAADSARVHLTEVSVENPSQPPMFCMLLRKHLSGGRLLNIRQDGLERVLYFEFQCLNELGDPVILTLAAEIMGRYSNLILIKEDGKILDSIRRVDPEMSSRRLVLPGMVYEAPPRDLRLNFLEAEMQDIRARLSEQHQPLPKALISVLEGISPILAREWSVYALRGEERHACDLTEDEMDRLLFQIGQTRRQLLQGCPCFQIVRTKEGDMKDFTFVRVQQYGSLMITKEMESACAVLDHFFAQRDSISRLKQRANDLFRLLLSTEERIRKRLINQQEELEACSKKEEAKRCGDLISANLYAIAPGVDYAEVQDFYEPDCPNKRIPLDVRLSPAQNAQRYYAKYRKAVTAEKKLTEQIAAGEAELAYVDSVFDALTRAESEGEIHELRLELAEQGYIKAARLREKPPKMKPPLRFESSDGFTILVGRNNRQNDQLTMKTAEKLDYWFHTQKLAGSHVIVQTHGETPPNRTLEEAAMLAAFHSKGQNSSQVPVDYCLVKYVRKPAGAKPGMVIFTNYQTAYLTPDPELINRLKAN